MHAGTSSTTPHSGHETACPAVAFNPARSYPHATHRPRCGRRPTRHHSHTVGTASTPAACQSLTYTATQYWFRAYSRYGPGGTFAAAEISSP
ncbi:MAG: hypothetical protein L6Q35_16685, partial [Phycisphaerales bacterium]|nr:hypothetical protein [Phycisphaerales bacterium]